MGQLYNRVSRLIRSELNHSKRESAAGNLGEGAVFLAGGAAAGASIGKIGILAGGTGFSVGAVPLGIAGALSGVALYEAIKTLIEGDSSDLGAVATGAVAGAGVSAAIGGIGVAVGGTAFGVGMAPMAAAGGLAGLGIAGLNRLLQQGIDPEKLLELAIEDMQTDLVKLRKAVIPVVAAQKRLSQQYDQTQTEVSKWQQRAQLALQKGNENLAREALIRKKTHDETASMLKAQLDQQSSQVAQLKRNLIAFESKVSEAKANKAMLKAQIAAAKAEVQLQSTIGRLNTSSAMAAFERMEDKVLEMEARSQAAYELAGNELEQQFALLESGSDIEDELAQMKAQLMSSPKSQEVLPSSQEKASSSLDSAGDEELDALRKQIDSL
ncbi:MAG TPA: PspA/IM30 family protein [Waterburya sp.]|jgi:phage shock protein A